MAQAQVTARELVFNQAAEENVIGVCLNYGEEAYLEAGALLRAEDFFHFRTRIIWEALGRLAAVRKGIDPYTVKQEMGAEFEKAGGMPYLMELAGLPAYRNHLAAYAADVREYSLRRSKIRQCQETIRALREGGGAAGGATSGIAREIISRGMLEDAALLEAGADRRIRKAGEGMYEVLEEILEGPAANGVTGLATGYEGFDQIGGGLQPGMTILAARPSVGKTTFALNVAYRVAISRGRPVLFFSLEMTLRQLQRKLMALGSGVNSKRFHNPGRIEAVQDRDLALTANAIHGAELYIYDSGCLKASELGLLARGFKALHPDLALVIIDYLGLLQPESRQGSTNDKVAETSRLVKLLANELNLPVLALHQLNRSLESRNDKTPGLADLRDSGALEQDADMVLFLHRNDYFQPTAPDPSETYLLVRKNRLEGGTGAVKLKYYKGEQRFQE